MQKEKVNAPVVLAKPFPGPQTWGLMCPVSEIFFGGARGGGKSMWLILMWLAHCFRCGGKARGLIVRRTREQLKDFKLECAMMKKLGWTSKNEENVWEGPDGSVLTLAYLENDKDAEEYQGWNLSFFAVDEAGNFPKSAPIDRLRATLRLPDVPEHRLLLTGNPGGAGHQWLKEAYIDPSPPLVPFVKSFQVPKDDGSGYETITSERVFIPSRLKDNPAANTPHYKASLAQAGPAWLVKAWLEGDWNVVPAGGLFDVDLINFGKPGLVERRVHGWDTALSVKTSADESARLEVGRDEARRLWIMDCWAGRLDAGAVGRKIVADATAREVRWVRCEGGPAGLAVEHVVRDEIYANVAMVQFELTSHMLDKVAKNSAFMAAVNTGQVWIPGTKEQPPAWWPALRDELLTFDGKDGKMDNRVDAGGVAFREIDRILATSPVIPPPAPPADRTRAWFEERKRAVQPPQQGVRTWRK
jgi:phage terminase large subunit-like protein